MLPNDQPTSPNQAIIDHYTKYDESQRLKHDIGPFEEARTRELILRCLPPPPAVVLDVGGANGPYSFWLAGLGYTVHLVDIVPRHIQQARQAMQDPATPQLASLRVGDARQLDFTDGCAAAVLMHGPLYHLDQRADRIAALVEARRVLQPQGVLLAFAITRYAGLVYGLTQGRIFDPAYLRMIANEVRTGLRKDPPAGTFTFPNAYFHLPEELRAEIVEAGLQHEVTLGVLGPAWQVPDLDASWQGPVQREVLMEIARLTEHEPILGPRLMALARNPA